MSKKIVCDICNCVISDSYKARVTTFHYVTKSEGGVCWDRPVKRRLKIDICHNCLAQIIVKSKELNNGGK